MARRASTGLSAPLRSTARGIYDMWRLGFSKSPAFDCGADQQTANHIITGCPLYRPPKWSPRLD